MSIRVVLIDDTRMFRDGLRLVIDMEAVTDADVTAAESFESLKEWLTANGISLAFSRLRPSTRPRLVRLGILEDHTVYETNRAAVAALAGRHDSAATPHHEKKGTTT